jgi:hypothetical protein
VTTDSKGQGVTAAPRLCNQDMAFDWRLNFTKPPTIAACAYWKSRCGERAMPERGDLNPKDMRTFTAHVGLVDVRNEADGTIEYFIRRAGGKWEDVFGPMTGRYIHEFLPPTIETRWREAFDRVRDKKAAVRATASIQFQRKFWLTAEMLIAPLGKAEVSMLFVTFVASRASSFA